MDDKSLLKTQHAVVREFERKADDATSSADFVRPHQNEIVKSNATAGASKSSSFISSASIKAKAQEHLIQQGKKSNESSESASSIGSLPASQSDRSSPTSLSQPNGNMPSTKAGDIAAQGLVKQTAQSFELDSSSGVAQRDSHASSDSSDKVPTLYDGLSPIIGVLGSRSTNRRSMSLDARDVKTKGKLKLYVDKDQVRGIASSQVAAARAHRYAKDLLSAIDKSLPFITGSEGIIMSDMMKALAAQSNMMKQRRSGQYVGVNTYNYQKSITENKEAAIRKLASATEKLDTASAVAAVAAADEAAKLAKSKAREQKEALEKELAYAKAQAEAKAQADTYAKSKAQILEENGVESEAFDNFVKSSSASNVKNFESGDEDVVTKTKKALRNGANPLYASAISSTIRDPFAPFTQAKVGASMINSLNSNTGVQGFDATTISGSSAPRVTLESFKLMEDAGSERLSAAEQAALNRTSDDELSLEFERTFALGTKSDSKQDDDDDYISDLNYGLFCSQDESNGDNGGGLTDLIDAAMAVFGARSDEFRAGRGQALDSEGNVLPSYIEGKVSHLPNADIYAFNRNDSSADNLEYEENKYGAYGKKLSQNQDNSFQKHIDEGHAMPFNEFNDGENLSLEDIARESAESAGHTPYYRIEHKHTRNGYMPCYFVYDNSLDSYLLDEGTCRLLGLEYTGEWMDSSTIDPTMSLLDSDEVYKVLFNKDAGNKLFSHVRILNGSHAGEKLFMTGAVICRDEAGIALNVVFYLSQIEARYLEAVLSLKNHCSAYDIDIKYKEVHFGPAYKQMIGLRPDEEMPASIEEWERNFVHPEDISIYRKQSDVVITSDIGDYYETIYRLRHKGGYYIWCIDRGLVVQRSEDGRATRVIGTTTNIDVVRANFERLKRSIYQDPLTSLHNRLYLNTRYKFFTQEECQPLSLVYADVSGLKVINDHLGHARGDELVKVAAKVLKEEIDIKHEVIRLSGDEFLMVFTQCDNATCKAAVAQMEERLADINQNHKYSLPIYFGFGVATLNEISDGDTFIRCEARADARLHEYKLKHHERIYSALKAFIEDSICCPVDLTDKRRLEYLEEGQSDTANTEHSSAELSTTKSQVAAKAESVSPAVQTIHEDTANSANADDDADTVKTAKLTAVGAGTNEYDAAFNNKQNIFKLDPSLVPHHKHVDEEALIRAAEESALAELNYSQNSMVIPDDLSASIDIELNRQGLTVVKVATPSTAKSQREREHIEKVLNTNLVRKPSITKASLNDKNMLNKEESSDHKSKAKGIEIGTELDKVKSINKDLSEPELSQSLKDTVANATKDFDKAAFKSNDSTALNSEAAASNLFSLFQDMSENGERDILSATEKLGDFAKGNNNKSDSSKNE